MPAFSISRSVVIEAPVTEVYAHVRDFNHWPTWSPWLIADPECVVTPAVDGAAYS